MSARFLGSSSEAIVQATSGFSAQLASFGGWLWIDSTASVQGIADRDGSGTQVQTVGCDGAGNLILHESGDTPITLALAAAQWVYFVARCITATNRRLSLLTNDAPAHVQSTINTGALSMGSARIGSARDPTDDSTSTFLTGAVAEFWIADIDVQADGAQLNDQMLRQLAYFGPWSLPHLAKNITDYRALRTGLDDRGYDPGDSYNRYTRAAQWLNSSTPPQFWAHPPLSPQYVRPQQTKPVLTV